ncbi:hypothetical protein FRC15_001436 [Serendipita sp. 397]|nr:hypothetical protein FRC15_001436 [Serendipita sp. 397]
MLSSSPNLTSVELPPSLQDVLKESQIWSNLQCFCSMGGQFWRNPLTPETPTDIILSKCLSIEKIVLSLIPWPNINTATISYVKLRYAVLRGEIQFMVRLRAPLLTFLSLYELPSYDGQQSESLHIELPSLKILSVDTANPSWIYRSNLPSLVSLSMNLTRGGYLSTHFFVPNGLPTVLDVKIEYLASDLAIIWALESFQNAETVKIVPVGQQLTLGRLTSQTLVRRLFSPEPFTLVPKAWYIQLGNAQTKVEGSMSVLEPLLRALVEDRKERGTPLQSINAHWAGLTSVVEYA